MFRPAVADTWLAEYIARDADTLLTKALQKSLSSTPSDAISPFLSLVKTDSSAAAAPATPTVSSLSGSDQDSAPKRHRVAAAASGKISKRKSRASKRSQTTFITADPANFRQMVQQVTGVRFGVGSMAPAVLKPEPQRAVGFAGGARLPAAGSGCLPTLDTSAFLLDHHLHHQVVGPDSAAGDGPGGPGPLQFGQHVGALDEASSLASAAGLDFETFSSFPTLESWKVM